MAAEDVQDHVQVEAGPLGWPLELGDVLLGGAVDGVPAGHLDLARHRLGQAGGVRHLPGGEPVADVLLGRGHVEAVGEFRHARLALEVHPAEGADAEGRAELAQVGVAGRLDRGLGPGHADGAGAPVEGGGAGAFGALLHDAGAHLLLPGAAERPEAEGGGRAGVQERGLPRSVAAGDESDAGQRHVGGGDAEHVLHAQAEGASATHAATSGWSSAPDGMAAGAVG